MINYSAKVKEYIQNLNDPSLEKAGIRAIKTLRTGKDKRSYKWIYVGLTNMPKQNWIDWGFGLLFHKPYQIQIDRIIEEEETLSWDWVDEDAAAEGDEVEVDPQNTILVYLGNGKEYHVMDKQRVPEFSAKIRKFPEQNKEVIEYLTAIGA